MTSFRCTVALVVVMAAAALQASAMSPMRTAMPTPATTSPPPPPPPPTTTPPPPPTTTRVCVMWDGSPFQGDIEPGQLLESSDGCSGCYCDEGSMSVYCYSAYCPPTSCHDSVKKPGVCCDECPNGYNCKTLNGTLVSDGQFVIENNENCTCSSEYAWMQTGNEGPQAICIPLPPPTTPPPPGCAFTNGTVVVGMKPGDDLQLDPCTTCVCMDHYVLECFSPSCPAPECSDFFTPQGQCCPQCP